MNNSYSSVPNIITGKDLDYLSDIFNWNYNAYKNSINMSLEVTDEVLSKHIENVSKLFLNGMETVLDILEEGEDNE